MDVKFTRSLCTCAPTKIEGYGPYRWKSASALLDIPKLPDELFQMISSPVRPAPTRTPRTTAPATATPSEAPTATEEEMQDLRDLCDCMTTDQINDYGMWLRLGMVLKRSGAPVSLWDEVSRRSSKYEHGECGNKWVDFNRRGEGEREVTIGSLHYWAEKGDTERYNKITRR